MKNIHKMTNLYCPIIQRNCVGEDCIACKKVFERPEDKVVLSYFKCENPNCGKKIEKDDKGFFQKEYCVSCGAGRVGEEYGIKKFYEKQNVMAKDSLYICKYFDTPSESKERESKLNNEYYTSFYPIPIEDEDLENE